jgi:hypothetical protein
MRSLSVQIVYCHSTQAYAEETLGTEMLENKWGLVASQSGYKDV